MAITLTRALERLQAGESDNQRWSVPCLAWEGRFLFQLHTPLPEFLQSINVEKAVKNNGGWRIKGLSDGTNTPALEGRVGALEVTEDGGAVVWAGMTSVPRSRESPATRSPALRPHPITPIMGP